MSFKKSKYPGLTDSKTRNKKRVVSKEVNIETNNEDKIKKSNRGTC